MENKDNISSEIQAIKAAWRYCDNNSEISIIYGAKHEDMKFSAYIEWDMKTRFPEIPDDIRTNAVKYVMEHYNL